MMTGAAMLSLAQSVIGTQTLEVLRFVSRTPNAAGKLVATYAAPEALEGNFQPVARNLYAQYGLDFAKTYYTLVIGADVVALKRGIDGDRLAYFGRLYSCESDTPWYNSDGYSISLCVDIGPAA